ncbi:unnamed protein product, partial [Mucor fragilis]
MTHSLNFDEHWHRLLPRCLGQDQCEWLNEFVKAAGSNVSWTVLKGAINARYGVPKEWLRFGRIREFLTCSKTEQETLDAFLDRFKRLRAKSGVSDKHVVAMVFFDAFPEAIARLIMVSMGQANESCFYDIEYVASVARRVDLAKCDKIGHGASSSAAGTGRKRIADIPVSPEVKKSKYASMPSESPDATFKKGPRLSKFGKTMKRHMEEHSCFKCNAAIRTPPGGNKVLRMMGKKPSRRDVDARLAGAMASEEAERVLLGRKNASLVSVSGRSVASVPVVAMAGTDSLESVARVGPADNDIVMSESSESATTDD